MSSEKKRFVNMSSKLKKLFILDMRFFLDKLYDRHEGKARKTYPGEEDIHISILPSMRPWKIFLANSDFVIQHGDVGEISISRRVAASRVRRKRAAAHLSALWLASQLLARKGLLDDLRIFNHKKRSHLSECILADAGLSEWSSKNSKTLLSKIKKRRNADKKLIDALEKCELDFIKIEEHLKRKKLSKKDIPRFIEKEEKDLKNLIDLVRQEISIGKSTDRDTAQLETDLESIEALLASMQKLSMLDARTAHKFFDKFEKEKARLLKRIKTPQTPPDLWDQLKAKQGLSWEK